LQDGIELEDSIGTVPNPAFKREIHFGNLLLHTKDPMKLEAREFAQAVVICLAASIHGSGSTIPEPSVQAPAPRWDSTRLDRFASMV